MTDGMVLPRGAGQTIGAAGLGVTLKVSAEQARSASSFELVVSPGFDVGAHVHSQLEELFYVVEGELDLLAFEPQVRTAGNWQAWRSRAGDRVVRGGPGTLMFVPTGCPHAFANPGTTVARVFFYAAPLGHERYFEELGEILSRGGPPDREAIAALRIRYDTEQLTPLIPAHAHS
ncbi:MAG TPA: cupin domain-containing protein [Thermomicrobiales bacterium]|nr:cupin domain-containing protein [Thermomicrobiales bacterium]